MLALAGPAPAGMEIADLWTRTPPESPSGRNTHGPGPALPGPAPGEPDRRSGPDAEASLLTVTVIVDPACPGSAPLLRQLAQGRARLLNVRVDAWLARPPERRRASVRGLGELAQAGIPLQWDPRVIRRLAPRALPAVYVQGAQGRRVTATGVPPLEALWRALQGSGR
jgi:hypothetical protein